MLTFNSFCLATLPDFLNKKTLAIGATAAANGYVSKPEDGWLAYGSSLANSVYSGVMEWGSHTSTALGESAPIAYDTRIGETERGAIGELKWADAKWEGVTNDPTAGDLERAPEIIKAAGIDWHFPCDD